MVWILGKGFCNDQQTGILFRLVLATELQDQISLAAKLQLQNRFAFCNYGRGERT